MGILEPTNWDESETNRDPYHKSYVTVLVSSDPHPGINSQIDSKIQSDESCPEDRWSDRFIMSSFWLDIKINGVTHHKNPQTS